jgi:hypothetical protein
MSVLHRKKYVLDRKKWQELIEQAKTLPGLYSLKRKRRKKKDVSED